ncbi:hypothetical protein [Massilia sp. YIM B02443]|uniref:hypothetical protein n=1 Tax=Massilia sp. YIM B02443 TaxID=3050127 RepID=UPI0025B70953|nr:hypothetical protein [Massilia sp. YIM B02443]MDN4036773.1 hypothetical protein [Massilia sp. YIM B02443]
MTGPVVIEHDRPLDEQGYRHHLLLLKSMHCARPVLYQGLNQFISCLSMNRDGGGISMTVYLAGKRDGIDSSEVQIKHATHERTTA